MTPAVDDATVHDHVARSVEAALGPGAVVQEVHRLPSPFATFFPAEVVTAECVGGETLKLFVKYIDGRQPAHPEKRRRDRELHAYAHLLGDPRLPVPRCYGTWWDPSAGNGLLLLEHIDDWNLKYHDLEHWMTAARRLAHLHAHFAEHPPTSADREVLLDLDTAFFADWARRAQETAAEFDLGLARRLEPVIRTWHELSALLTEATQTVVHNDLAPKNVIADRGSRPARICIIDWEVAGFGCGLLDVVHLGYGFDPVNAALLREAYESELTGSGLLPDRRDELDALFAAAALHKTLYRIAASGRWSLPVERVAEWVAEAERHAEEAARS